MKKKLIILFILVLTKSLFADEKILYDFISKINKENTWLPVEYLEVIKSVDREKIKQYLPKIGDNKVYLDYLEEYKEWYDESVYEPEKLELEKKREVNKEVYILHFSFSYSYYINNVEGTNTFIASLQQTVGSKFQTFHIDEYNQLIKENNLRKTPLYSENPSYYDDEEYKYDEIIIDAKFIFDGDYLTVYANEDKFKQVYFKCTEETYEQLKSLIYTNTIDISKVTWPRHADGSCDYELTQKTSFTLESIMTVKENLKLRSEEATSSEGLTVMSEGSKVQILEIGKSDIIGGIKSNWVKVKIQKGSRTPEGHLIRPGLIGWCYGGYLK